MGYPMAKVHINIPMVMCTVDNGHKVLKLDKDLTNMEQMDHNLLVHGLKAVLQVVNGSIKMVIHGKGILKMEDLLAKVHTLLKVVRISRMVNGLKFFKTKPTKKA